METVSGCLWFNSLQTIALTLQRREGMVRSPVT